MTSWWTWHLWRSHLRQWRRLAITTRASLVILVALSGAVPSHALAQTPPPPRLRDVPRKIDPADIRLDPGYKIEPVAVNLSVTTTLTFDGGDLLVAESGWQDTAQPRILRLSPGQPDGNVRVLAANGLEWPVTGLLVVDGQLYVSHKGKVSIVGADGTLHDVVTDLPSKGDHQNNTLALGPDGKIYMGQGTVTNSAVVGVDNYIFGWLPEQPALHETPCQDITLTGENFETENPLNRQGPHVTTGAYQPFGTPSQPGEVVKGDTRCGGSIVRFDKDGSGFEVVAWGLRNPFGLRFDRQSQLWATYQGADVRGSRNIFNDPDYLVRVEQGAWYGWPEYFDGQPVTDEAFHAPGHPKPAFLWREHPPLAKAFTTFEPHAAANGLDFSPGSRFGFEGDAFVAEFGTFAPVTTGINIQVPGFRVVRVDMATGRVHDFAANTRPGPAYLNQGGGFSRPSDVMFAPDGSLYVADWGHSTLTNLGLQLTPQTGVVWRIYPDSLAPVRPSGPIVVGAAPVPETQRKAEVRNVPEGYRMIAPELTMVLSVLALVVVLIFGALTLRHHAQRRET